MTIREAIGIDLIGRDTKTEEEVSSKEKIQRAIEYLGGPKAIAPYIPFPLPVLAEKLKSDPNLNNTSLRKWDLAAGFRDIILSTNQVLIRGGIWELYGEKGITSASCANGVCILKTAAQMLIETQK